MTTWRVGTHYKVHVYEGETPVCTALTPEFAARIVADHNRPAEVAVPQPVDREALEEVLHDHYYGAGWSREHQGFRCVCGWLGDDHVQHAADQVLALLSTSGDEK